MSVLRRLFLQLRHALLANHAASVATLIVGKTPLFLSGNAGIAAITNSNNSFWQLHVFVWLD